MNDDSITNIEIDNDELLFEATLRPSQFEDYIGQEKTKRNLEIFIEAARINAASTVRILWQHVLPNVMVPIIILASLRLGQVILIEASLSFLGYGVPAPFPSWGRMLSSESRNYMETAPWLAIWPGVFLSLTVFGWNVLGDALRDLLDPRMRGTGGGYRS